MDSMERSAFFVAEAGNGNPKQFWLVQEWSSMTDTLLLTQLQSNTR